MSESTTRRKSIFLFGLGFLLLFITSLVHISQGQAGYSVMTLLIEVWTNGRVQDVVLGLRLPRVVIGILAGGALAVAGVLLQTITKNPLASASTLGMNAGAHLFVISAIIFLPGTLGQFPFLVAFLGAACASLLVMMLVGKAMEPVRVALTGMVVALLFSSITGSLQLIFENETNGLFLWGSGTLVQLDWSGVQFAVGFILAGVGIALLNAKSLDVLTLGEDIATSLGQPVQRVKLFAWISAILLAATTVSVVGPIGFVGLIAPHLVRMMGVKGHLPLIIHSFLWGAILLITADILARWIQPGQEIPVGAMTALIGGPWLMYLAYKTGKKHSRRQTKLGGHSVAAPYPVLLAIGAIVSIMVTALSVSYGAGSFFSWNDWLNQAYLSPFVWEFRVPRILTAFIVGMLLAMCGVLLQGVLRNPLADPTVLGITSGGGAGAMIFLVLFPAVSIQFLPFAAMIGAAVSMGIILLVTWRSNWEPILLALMGVAVSAVGSAIIQIMVVKAKMGVAPALAWLAGSTYAKSWSHLQIVFLVALIAIPLGWFLSRKLDLLSFGDDVSTGLGMNVGQTRILAIMLGVAMGAASVSIVGTIGFIGLLAPHAVRRLVGVEHRRLIPLSLLLGGILLVAADFVGRFILAPKEIPAGLVVAVLGTPYILYLLRKT
ncbi:Fe(3+)-hydroxamate ABC transporter permease FhuB [Alkalihalophilus marmarensis]|uniref:Iron ABC transporter permease n=1 Tax=Alkalihalophilus marmarensis DSM 21297 TaxID=1188261 RepID=U6SHW1_9BACI|nr:Fe(3+)-hydroxamate ABC transporter permease FhuB [Alkalihalophilus marmarensis]ERN51163.1 iron ABC transporter permease [Alkalihalophilus marmarensis DSM 21297]MCM3491361.1 Fe(3+)-hydroxamate ABC transporter permease FhuB [Alkalihalophilus marmarensis]